MINIGIDPGAKGAIAILDEQSLIEVFDLPIAADGKTLDCASILARLQRYSLGGKVILEKVAAMPGQGVTSMFNFGKNVGQLIGILKISKIPYEEIPPTVWRKKVLVGCPKNSKDPKAVVRGFVERRFPDANIYGVKGGFKDGRADALCLALYGFKTGEKE